MPTTAQQSVQLVPYDFEHHVTKLIEYLQHHLPDVYQDFLEDNAARTLIDAISFEASLISYMINVNAKEWFLPTASTRKAMYLLGRLVDYTLTSKTASIVTLKFTLSAASTVDIVIPQGFRVQSQDGTATFETDSAVTLDAGDTTVEVAATQGSTVVEIVGVSTGAARQEYTSTSQGIMDSLVVYVDDIAWTNFETNLVMVSTDKGYTCMYDEEFKLIIEFGSGEFGMIPPTGSRIKMSYRHGGGFEGNVGVGTLTELLDEVTDNNGTVVTTLSVTNAAAASGGGDEESIDDARLNIPLSVRSMDRLVSEEDHEAIVGYFSDATYGSVYKSGAVVTTFTWAQHVVKIYILATDPNGLPATAGTGLVASVQSWVDEHKLPSVIAVVDSGTLVTVDIAAVIHHSSNYRTNQIRASVNLAIIDLFNYSGRKIGDGLYLSDIYNVFTNIDGVEYITVTAPTGDVSGKSGQFLVQGTMTITYAEVT